MQRFYQSLSKKDRRRYAGVEALKLGWGGKSYISQLLRCDDRFIGNNILNTEKKWANFISVR